MTTSDHVRVAHCLEDNYSQPDFWNLNVCFFANLKSLFLGNQEQTHELTELVGELDSYGGRLTPVLNLLYTGGNNLLFLEKEPDAALMDYFRTGVGLDLPDIRILPHDEYEAEDPQAVDRVRQLLPSEPVAVDGYVTDDRLKSWATHLGRETRSSRRGYRIGNNKTELYRFLESQSLPTPETHVADRARDIHEALGDLKKQGFRRAVIRAAIGASGIGMIIVDLREDQLVKIPHMLFHGGPCLVQGWIEPGVGATVSVSSPSVQFFISDDAIDLYDITDQILSEKSVHEGNYSPPEGLNMEHRNNLISQTRAIGGWLHERGYRGTGSADFLVVRGRNQKTVAYACEVNARVTGATYPSVLARHLRPDGAWLMRNLRFQSDISAGEIIKKMDQSGHLYGNKQSSGVIPLNFNSDQDNRVKKGQFLCLGPDVKRCLDQLESLIDQLPCPTIIERD